MNFVSTSAPTVQRGQLALLALFLIVACSRAGEPGVIDFRNFIPDGIDAPVYRVNGTNRLSGSAYMAQLYCSDSDNPASFAPVGSAVPFGAGEDAGYWHDRKSATPVSVFTTFTPGERVWVQVRAWQASGDIVTYDSIPPPRLWGRSETFSIIISNIPTPLIGLKSFQLEPAPLRQIARQGDEVVLRWSAGDGTAHYKVEVTPSLRPPVVWRPAPGQPQLIIMRESNPVWFSPYWFADWVITNTIVGSTAFYRIGLLDP